MAFDVDKKILVELRKKTMAGFSDCKKALEETKNHLEDAVIWLRKNGIAKASSKFSGKTAQEGQVFVAKDDFGAIIFELNAETDFTAKSDPFNKLSELIMNAALSNKEGDVKKINNIKINSGNTIESEILSLSSITGEKIQLSKSKYLPKNKQEMIAVYQHHNKKIATIVKVNSCVDVDEIKKLAIHLAANNPIFFSPQDADEKWIENEKNVSRELFKKENKPEAIMEKIINNKIEKLLTENSFLTQAYLFDAKKSVSDFAKSLNTEILEAIYFELGK